MFHKGCLCATNKTNSREIIFRRFFHDQQQHHQDPADVRSTASAPLDFTFNNFNVNFSQRSSPLSKWKSMDSLDTTEDMHMMSLLQNSLTDHTRFEMVDSKDNSISDVTQFKREQRFEQFAADDNFQINEQ